MGDMEDEWFPSCCKSPDQGTGQTQGIFIQSAVWFIEEKYIRLNGNGACNGNTPRHSPRKGTCPKIGSLIQIQFAKQTKSELPGIPP